MVAALATPGRAQDSLSSFLFNDYHDAVVHFHDGKKSAEKVNYNLLESALYFIDARDGQIKVVADYRGIDSLVIAGRTFLLDGKEALEKVSAAPVIYIRFNANSTYKPDPTAYGGSSQLSAVDTYSSGRYQAKWVDLKDKERQVSQVYHDYLIEKDGKRKRISSFKQLYRLYPAHREALEKYVADRGADFNDVGLMITLCRYAEDL